MTELKKTTAALPGAAWDVTKADSFQGKCTPTNDFREHNDFHKECLAHMAINGIPFLGPLKCNSGVQRFSIDAKKNKFDEWYLAKAWEFEGRPYFTCKYGSWSSQSKYTYLSWESNESVPLDTKKNELFTKYLKEVDSIAKAEEIKRQDEASKEANAIWDMASTVPITEGHSAYLNSKSIQPYGVRFGKNPYGYDALIIPLKNIEGTIRSLQFISVGDNGVVYKTFLAGGQKKGCFFAIGELCSDIIYIGEGYATASSVHEATEKSVVVAFDCGNLDPVIGKLKEKYPKQKIIIAGDDDVEVSPSSQFPMGNPGRSKAEEAAKKHGCETVFPKFNHGFKLPNEKSPTDWNDLHLHFGLDEVRAQLSRFHKEKPRLITLSYEELISKEIPPRKIILKPWLPEAGISLIYAPTGVGKTYLCLSIAKAIASGGRLFDWEAPEQKRVLYVDAEMHESDLKMRVKKLTNNIAVPPEYLRYWNGSWQSNLCLPDLSIEEGQQLIEELIDHYGIQVLFLDNLSTLCRTGKENEANSWIKMQNWLLKLRWKEVATVLVHHAGKTKDPSGKPVQRGTSMREVILESSLVLSHPKDYTEEQGCVFEVAFTKARGFWGADSAPFEAKLIEKDDGCVWEYQPLSVKTYDLVVDLYNNQGITSSGKIAFEIGITRQAVDKQLNKARKNGDISKKNPS